MKQVRPSKMKKDKQISIRINSFILDHLKSKNLTPQKLLDFAVDYKIDAKFEIKIKQ